MIALLLAVAALFVGPLLAAALRRSPAALYALDGFVLVAVSFLVLFSVLPDAMAHSGLLAALLAALGFALPTLAERGWHSGHRGAHRAVLVLSIFGLVLHEALDGAGLAISAGPAAPANVEHAAVWAILLHRFSLGLFLWLTVRPLFGARAALLAIAAAALASLAGYWAYTVVSPTEQSDAASLLLAFIGGALLHVLVHQVQPVQASPAAPRCGALGGLAALLVLTLPSAGLRRDLLDFLVYVTLAIWIPVLLAGVLSSLLTTRPAPERLLRQGGVLPGLLLAITTPVCSCGIVPVYEDLAGHGVDGRTRLAFLLGAPVLRLEAFVLAGWLFGIPLAALWLACALLLIAACAWIFGPRWRVVPGRVLADGTDSGHAKEEALSARPASWWSYFTGDWLDHNAAWTLIAIVFGLLASAYVAQQRPALPDVLSQAPGGILAAVALVLAAVPVYLHPLVALSLATLPLLFPQAFPWGLLLLLIGPMTSVASRRAVMRLHGRATSWSLTAALTAGAILCVLATILLLPDFPRAVGSAPVNLRIGQWLQSLGIPSWLLLAALFPALLSFWRCGPRGWLSEILPPQGHEHAHHPGVPHEHGTRARVQIDAADGS